MTALFDAVIRSSLLLAIGLGLAAALGHRPAAWRHLVLATAIFAAVAVVPLSRTLPRWEFLTVEAVPVTVAVKPGPAQVNVTSTAPSVAAATVDGGTSWVSTVASVWLAGVIVALAVLLTRVLRLVWLSARAERVDDERWQQAARTICTRYGINRQPALLRTDAPDLIATWGAVRPRVLLPAESGTWSDDRLHAVLCHELAHVRRHDWVVQMLAEAARAIGWCHPLMAIACRRLRRESEHACDDAVLGLGVPASSYASHLLALAQTSRAARLSAMALPMARPSTLERRIAAMLIQGTDRRALSRRAVVATAALMTVATLSTAALQGVQGAPAPLGGVIYDPSGAVLPGVTVSLQDSQDFKWQAETDAAGHFEFPPVQPGRYVLEATLMGFNVLRQEFSLRQTSDWDRAITMQVGVLTETINVSASRAAPVAARTGPTPVRVGGNIKAPLKLVNVNPVYPASMRQAGRAGDVKMEAIIGQDGAVLSVRVLGAHVHPDFAMAAVDAVRQWLFSPTLLNGKPVEVVMNVSVNFTLAD